MSTSTRTDEPRLILCGECRTKEACSAVQKCALLSMMARRLGFVPPPPTAPAYRVERTQCACRPETCCCPDLSLWLGSRLIARGNDEGELKKIAAEANSNSRVLAPTNLVPRLRETARYYALPPANDVLVALLSEAAEALDVRPNPVIRILRAAVAFVDAIESRGQIDAVASQALHEWVELADAVIVGRGAVPSPSDLTPAYAITESEITNAESLAKARTDGTSEKAVDDLLEILSGHCCSQTNERGQA